MFSLLMSLTAQIKGVCSPLNCVCVTTEQSVDLLMTGSPLCPLVLKSGFIISPLRFSLLLDPFPFPLFSLIIVHAISSPVSASGHHSVSTSTHNHGELDNRVLVLS